jgi:hypothetical protein
MLAHLLPWHRVRVPSNSPFALLEDLRIWRYRWNFLIRFFPKSPTALQSDISNFLLLVTCAAPEIHGEHEQNQLSTHILVVFV